MNASQGVPVPNGVQGKMRVFVKKLGASQSTFSLASPDVKRHPYYWRFASGTK